MRQNSEFALPVKVPKVPAGPDWFHEIKHDGYRMKLIREGGIVRLRSMSGVDLDRRFPGIIEGALQISQKQFVLDGEVVVLDEVGMSDFSALHSRKRDDAAVFYAFDMLAADGEDYRRLPLFLRKTNLAQLLDPRPDGIFAASYEQGEIGPKLFTAACKMGLEGLVSKHRESTYRCGRCSQWVKVKNPKHPAYSRVQDQFKR